jgi:hypothetical protein
MPGKNPLVVVSGVLKSACASIQTTPVYACSIPVRTPWEVVQDPARTSGNCPAPMAARTNAAVALFTANEEEAVSEKDPGRLTDRTVTSCRSARRSTAPASSRCLGPKLAG